MRSEGTSSGCAMGCLRVSGEGKEQIKSSLQGSVAPAGGPQPVAEEGGEPRSLAELAERLF